MDNTTNTKEGKDGKLEKLNGLKWSGHDNAQLDIVLKS